MNLREMFATFGLNFDSSGVDAAEGGIQKLWGTVQGFAGALASGAIAAGLWSFVQDIAGLADDIGDLATRTGVASGSLQRIGSALGTVGLDINATAGLMERMNIAMSDGGDPGKFEALGVETRDATGALRDTESVFLEVTDSVAALGSAAERTAALNEIFGRQGRALGASLGGGENQIRSLVEAMGGLEGISQEVIDGAGELETQQTVLDFAFTSMKSTLAKELMPAVIAMVTWFLKLTKGFYSVVKQSNAVKAVLALMGAGMVYWGLASSAAWLPVVASFLAVALAVGLVVAIVDDIITLFQGGDSVIGQFIDSMLGVGSSALFVEGVKLAWERLTDAIPKAWDAIASGAVAWSDWVEGAAAGASAFANGLIADWTEIGAYLSGVAASISSAFMDVWSDPMGAAVVFWDWIVGFIEDKVSGIGSSISGLLNRATGGVLGTASAGPSATPRTASATPRAAPQGGTTVVQNNSVPITITGNPSAEERRRLQAAIAETLDARNRAAQAALVPNPG